jgi:hypothetical protein
MQDTATGGTGATIYLKAYADNTVFDGYTLLANVTSNNPAIPSLGDTRGYASGWQYYLLHSNAVTVPTMVTITVVQPGNSRTLVDSIQILPPAPALASITATPNPGKSANPITVTVTLTVAPFTGPVVVTFNPPPPGFTYPSSITVPVGSMSGSVTITPPKLRATANITLTGSYNGVSKTVTVRIDP